MCLQASAGSLELVAVEQACRDSTSHSDPLQPHLIPSVPSALSLELLNLQRGCLPPCALLQHETALSSESKETGLNGVQLQRQQLQRQLQG